MNYIPNFSVPAVFSVFLLLFYHNAYNCLLKNNLEIKTM